MSEPEMWAAYPNNLQQINNGKADLMGRRLLGIPICASAFLGEEVVVIQKIKCPNHKCGETDF